MSNPDPNNPYGPPQSGQQLPSYPQGGGQPYGGYPGGQPYGGYPGGDMMPPQMPGTLKAARVLLFVFGGLGIIGGVFAVIGGTMLSDAAVQDAFRDQGFELDDSQAGLIITVGVLSVLLSIAQIVVAAKFGNGGNGIRAGAIVCAALMIVLSFFYLPFGVLWIIVGILVIVFAALGSAGAWFARPRH